MEGQGVVRGGGRAMGGRCVCTGSLGSVPNRPGAAGTFQDGGGLGAVPGSARGPVGQAEPPGGLGFVKAGGGTEFACEDRQAGF